MSQCYRQLRLDEREALFRMKDARLQVSRIAEQLGRHPSTIYRESVRNLELAGYVIDRPHRSRSPEQIAGLLRFACQNGLRVSHETIY